MSWVLSFDRAANLSIDRHVVRWFRFVVEQLNISQYLDIVHFPAFQTTRKRRLRSPTSLHILCAACMKTRPSPPQNASTVGERFGSKTWRSTMLIFLSNYCSRTQSESNTSMHIDTNGTFVLSSTRHAGKPFEAGISGLFLRGLS